ncbi:BapA prefix-like domain-containing protein [Apirhabdus apintestini]|nr:BapA prefix-like domain-containing protein [Enterobacteriaceae bacterium CA-0114]
MIEVIVRKTAAKTALSGEGNLSVSLTAPSVIEIHASAADVARYVRQGKDLLIYMKDGSVIRCSGYFVAEGADGHSELVFADEQGLTHISFPDAADTVGMAPVTLKPHASPIASIAPFLEHASGDSQVWGWAAGAALGGGAIGALLAHDSGGDDKHHTKIIDKTREVESAKPSFVVSDHKGDSQGVLSANATTDDATPTFSGTGQPGATIQIKDAKGNTIASAMVGKDGAWSVKLPTQSDGTHSWSVVQIDGDKTTAAGNITLNVDTRDASVALDTTTGDNVINGAEQAAGFTLGGHSEHLVNGTVLTVSLNGKTYKTTVDVHGKWSDAGSRR